MATWQSKGFNKTQTCAHPVGFEQENLVYGPKYSKMTPVWFKKIFFVGMA